MRIRPLNNLQDKIRSRLRAIDKSLPQEVLNVKPSPTPIDSLIVLGNGSEDDVVVALVCHHLNGDKTVAIAKPKSTRYGAIGELKVYFKDIKYKIVTLILDQEDDELPMLNTEVRKKLREIGIECREGKQIADRVLSYDCNLGGHTFELVVVVNGLDGVGGPNHKIEDHLVMLAGVAGEGDSKEVWNKLDEGTRRDVYRKILNDRKEAERVFAQHFAGLGLLDC